MSKKGSGFIGSTLKPIIDVRSWFGYDQIKGQTSYLFRITRALLDFKKATYKETFEQAMARLNLTEKDIEAQKHRYLIHMFIYLGFGFCIVCYFFHLLWNAHFIAAVLAFLVCLLFAIKAAEAHFHYFQMQHKKLDYTLTEWLHTIIFGEQSK